MDKLLLGFGGLLTGLFIFALRGGFHKIEYIADQLNTRNGGWSIRDLLGVTDLSIHHTAGGSSETAEGIANYHVNNKLWNAIGYHILITFDGRILQTNDFNRKSWHNGYNNSNAIGIAIQGNFETNKPTEKQLSALSWLVMELKANKDLPNLNRLVGHNEYPGSSTACPGKNLDLYRLRELTSMNGINRVNTLYSSFMGTSGENDYDSTKADN